MIEEKNLLDSLTIGVSKSGLLHHARLGSEIVSALSQSGSFVS